MKLIGFHGSMGAGKSSAIEFLRFTAPFQVVNIKFAQPLYDMQSYIYSRISPVYKKPEGFVKDRKLLQWLGTEWGRDSISQTLWVDIWKEDVEGRARLCPEAIFVCDDVRFDNEAEAIRSLGGKVLKIHAPGSQARAEGGEGIKAHASEAGISSDLIDKDIYNTGTLAYLKEQIDFHYNNFAKQWQTNSNK